MTPPPAWRRRAARLALLGLAPACALGGFASELTVGVALAVGVALHLRDLRRAPGFLGGQATWSYAAVWLLMAPVSGNVHEALGHVWPIAALLAVPLLRAVHDDTGPTVRAGLVTAAGLGAWAAVEGLFREAHGPFSHHLTLAYALLPPLGVALHRRSALALPIALGVLGARSTGALVGLGVTAALGLWAARDAARGRLRPPALRAPAAALAGMALTAATLPWADPTELHERAVLWTGGLRIGLRAPVGPGGYPAASTPAYDALERGFYFPNHAHDSATQLLAVLGPAGWLCGLMLVGALFEAFGAGAAAGLAGVCVGAFTQDTFGDLEVIRAVTVWGAL